MKNSKISVALLIITASAKTSTYAVELSSNKCALGALARWKPDHDTSRMSHVQKLQAAGIKTHRYNK